jgi:peptide-methionine (S)-S-oxide reductase
MTDTIARVFRSWSAGPGRAVAVTVVALGVAAMFGQLPVGAAEPATVIPAPTADAPAPSGDGLQTIVLAGGCFWGIQAVYQHVEGVHNAVSGYAGGSSANPTYEQVSSGRTGHAESVQVTYDPRKVSLGKILQIYFSVAHDPTQLNRQGPDVGTQYRSAIYFVNEDQQRVARAYIAQLDAAKAYPRPIVTEVAPLAQFYPAEAYHQDYLASHKTQPYIVYNDLPKLDALQKQFPAIYIAAK